MDRRASLAMTDEGGRSPRLACDDRLGVRGEGRHCERSAAIYDCAFSTMDRRASLAMTDEGGRSLRLACDDG